MRTLCGLGLTATLLTGVGAGLFQVGEALAGPQAASRAGPGARRAEMASAGIDPMPVGTARQVDRAKRLRGP